MRRQASGRRRFPSISALLSRVAGAADGAKMRARACRRCRRLSRLDGGGAEVAAAAASDEKRARMRLFLLALRLPPMCGQQQAVLHARVRVTI